MNPSSILNSSLEALMERLRPVLVVVHNGRHGAGAGLAVGDGQVLTSYHVVAHGRSIKILLDDDTSFKAQIRYAEAATDLALLGTAAPNLPSALFSEQEPRSGEMVFAFGHPWGQRAVLTAGVLSAATTVRTQNGDFPVLRTDARLAPGNSGGPLLNAAGEVIGLNAMIFGGDQGIAIPVSVIRTFFRKAGLLMPHNNLMEAVL